MSPPADQVTGTMRPLTTMATLARGHAGAGAGGWGMQGQGSLLIVRMSGVRVPLQILASIITAGTMPSSGGDGAGAWEPQPGCRPCVLAILELLW